MMVLYSGESVASSMDEGFEFEANHHFFYLTGLRRENMALVLANTHHPAHVILFIEEPIPDMERWTGRRVTIDEAKAVSGIDDVRYIDSVEGLISRCVARETVEAAYFDCYRNAMGDTDSYNMQKAKRFAQQYPTIALKNAHMMLSAMRMVKDEAEIKTLERAIAITDQGLRRVLATLEPGRMEYQQQAEFEYEIRMRGAERTTASWRTASCCCSTSARGWRATAPTSPEPTRLAARIRRARRRFTTSCCAPTGRWPRPRGRA